MGMLTGDLGLPRSDGGLTDLIMAAPAQKLLSMRRGRSKEIFFLPEPDQISCWATPTHMIATRVTNALVRKFNPTAE